MKAVLVIEMPNEYADRYNVNEMYVWGLTVQDKHGYEMFDLVTDEPNHLRPLPQELDNISALPEDPNNWSFVHYESLGYEEGWNACLEEIMGKTE